MPTRHPLILIVVSISLIFVHVRPASPQTPFEFFRPTAQAEIVPSDAQLEILWEEGGFTEGPVADDDGSVLFSDIKINTEVGNRILRYIPKTGKVETYREPSGQANGLIFDAKHRLIAAEGAAGGGRRVSITEADGHVRTLAEKFDGKRLNSPNDVAVDASGRVYFTDPRYVGDEERELDFEAVYVIGAGDTLKIATQDVQKPNGIVVSPDQKTVYVADAAPNGNQQLLGFKVNDDGTLKDKKVLFDFGQERRGIDGMTVNARGEIFAAAGKGHESAIYVFSPKGKPLALIPLPGPPTNCELGRGTRANTLYITGEMPNKKYGLYRIKLKERS